MSDFMTVKKSSIKEDNLIIKKKGLVYSILVMFILGTLFLFLMFYILMERRCLIGPLQREGVP